MSEIKQWDAAAMREAFARERRITSTPVSRAERDARIAARKQPRSEAHLTPGGHVEQTVYQLLDAENERRIHFIAKRLARMNGKVRADFDRSCR